MRATKYRDRILEAVEHEVVTFPGAVRPPGDLAEFYAEQQAWSVIRSIRKRNIAEQRRLLFMRRSIVAVMSIRDAVMWAWGSARRLTKH